MEQPQSVEAMLRVCNDYRRAGHLFCLALILIHSAVLIRAQGLTSNSVPSVIQDVGIDQKLGANLPLELAFVNEEGNTVQLADYFGLKPVVLALVYYECPRLCPQVLHGIVKSLRPLSFTIGEEFDLITVSIDPEEGPVAASSAEKRYVREYGRPDAASGWHFLTGEEANIERLAHAVGFRYAYDAQNDQYAHAAGIIVATPQGKLSRYFYGIEYSARDLRLGLVEASANRIGSPIDQLLLYCYHYDPMTGKYGVVIMNVLRLAGGATVLALGSLIFMMLRREQKKEQLS